MNRCADKILTQLETHAKAELYFGGNGFEGNGQRKAQQHSTSVRIEYKEQVSDIRTSLLDLVYFIRDGWPIRDSCYV